MAQRTLGQGRVGKVQEGSADVDIIAGDLERPGPKGHSSGEAKKRGGKEEKGAGSSTGVINLVKDKKRSR